MNLWALVGLRIGALSLERVAFHGLGRKADVLAATVVAYGGAAFWLWLFALMRGQAHWVGEGFWAGGIYAASFFLYTAALAKGPVSVVSSFANVTVVFLFVAQPRWDAGTLAGLGVFLAGAAFLVSWDVPLSSSVGWMIASGFLLALGRLIDLRQAGLFSVSYAASLFTSVVVWLAVPMTLRRGWRRVLDLGRQRTAWSVLASAANAVAYLTVLALLPVLKPHLVEAVSSWAAVAATVISVLFMGERGASRKIAGAALMTLGTTALLLFSRRPN